MNTSNSKTYAYETQAADSRIRLFPKIGPLSVEIAESFGWLTFVDGEIVNSYLRDSKNSSENGASDLVSDAIRVRRLYYKNLLLAAMIIAVITFIIAFCMR